jgi:GNAT superfamily N-acetyltransferase
MYQNTVFDAGCEVRLWEEDGELVGFAWLEKPDGVVMQVHPRLRGSGPLEREMLEWGARQTRAVYGEQQEDELWTRVTEDEPRLAALLAELSFEPDPDHALMMSRDLHAPIPGSILPDGWTVREVGGEEEWEARVEIHREVWHPSRVTLEAYRRLRAAPLYNGRLDLVAVAPDGSFGSYCICWYDPGSHTGLFEPVGTRATYRGLGLGKSVMHEGLRRLRDLGAHTASVVAFHDNEAARNLYQSVGFETVNTERLYGKKL